MITKQSLMPANSYQDIVDRLQLTPHPEGGFFRRTYCSPLAVDMQGKSRWCSTGIYYLLPQGEKSYFHRLESDEMWHFYRGESLMLLEITLNGQLKKTKIGPDLLGEELLQYVVPAGHWFAAYPDGEYSLVGCTMAPGFDYEDFELGKKEKLLQEYPHHRLEIERFCLSS